MKSNKINKLSIKKLISGLFVYGNYVVKKNNIKTASKKLTKIKG